MIVVRRVALHLCLLAFTGSCSDASARQPASSQPDLHVDVFGERVGEPIDSGFVFADGEYMDKPYRVTRRGTSLYVNDRRVRTYRITWPPYKLEVDEDPGIPAGLTRDSDFPEDPSPDAFFRRKLRYLYQHFPPDEARRRMIEFYRSLPFVKEVRHADPPGSSIVIEVVTHRNRSHKIYLESGRNAAVRKTATRSELTQWLEKQRSRIDSELRRGNCLMVCGRGKEISFGPDKANKALPPVVDALASNASADEKLATLERWGVIPQNCRKTYASLVKGFKTSPQLTARIAEIRKKHPHRVPPLMHSEVEECREEAERRTANKNEWKRVFRQLVRQKQQQLEREYRKP